MKCPNCPDVTLVMSERDSVEIDYCPSCRGVWLDRGELDKIIERSSQELAKLQPSPAASMHKPQANHRPDFDDSDFSHHKSGYGHGHGKYQKSWLNKIFD
jgi:uncharacterized protein